MGPRNLDRLTRVYGPTTWDVYDQLDLSLEPDGPDSLFDLAGTYVSGDSAVLDVGCRDGAHLIELVQRFGVAGVGVEPVPIHVTRAREVVDNAGLGDQIEIRQSTMHDIPVSDDYFDFVWCRDVLEQVDDLAGGLSELTRVTRPGAALLVYTTVATDRLTIAEREMLRCSLGNVDENLDRARLEIAFEKAGLTIESVRDIGTEWREYSEERSQPVSQSLLRLARLRRQQDQIVADHGQDIFDHIEANLHWELFQFLGKLTSLIYILRAPSK